MRLIKKLFSKHIKVGLYVYEKDSTCSDQSNTNIIGCAEFVPLKSPLDYEQTKQMYQG